MINYLKIIRNNYLAVLLVILIGICSYFLSFFVVVGIADPLIISLVIGLVLNIIIPNKRFLKQGIEKLPFLFISIGIMFYGLRNLNFLTVREINPYYVVLLIAVMLTYYFSSIFLGRILGLKKEITYLTATGGAICGASAITVTAPAVEADSDDISISLISVFLAAVFGLFILLPLLAVSANFSNEAYALLSGTVMQFTGFVKASINIMPPLESVLHADEIMKFALSIKAFRYLGLLIAIPLFASLIKGKVFLPWYLGAFLGAGILGTMSVYYQNQFYIDNISYLIKPTYNILWSIALATIGLNANTKKLFSNSGIKAIVVAYLSFLCAVGAFFIGFKLFLT